MRRKIAALVLLGLGFAFVVHPLAHGLEQNPELCAVSQLSKESPAVAPTAAPSVLPVHGLSFEVPAPAPAQATSLPSSPVSRGPPQA